MYPVHQLPSCLPAGPFGCAKHTPACLLVQVLTWSVILINAAFVWLAIILLSIRQSDIWTAGQVGCAGWAVTRSRG